MSYSLNGINTGREEYVVTVNDNKVLIIFPIFEITGVMSVLSLQIIGK